MHEPGFERRPVGHAAREACLLARRQVFGDLASERVPSGTTSRAHYPSVFRKTSDVFTPPNAKLLLITTEGDVEIDSRK